MTAFIEEFFSAPLDPDLIASTPRLTSDVIGNLFEEYQQFTRSFSPPVRNVHELVPINHRFPVAHTRREPAVAEQYLERAMSQLLYAHRCIFVDSLGHNLAVWSHPIKHYQTSVAWDTERQYRVGFQNYLETLVYLRPLIDADLVDILPFVPDMDPPNSHSEVTFGCGMPMIGYLVALEMIKGVEYSKEIALKLADPELSVALALNESQTYEYMSFTRAYADLHNKVKLPWASAGDLSLETAAQMRVLRHLLSNTSASLPRANAIATVETLVLPQIASLLPSDVVALHSRTEWEDFRLALSHGLERIMSHSPESSEYHRDCIVEELGVVGRAAERATKNSKLIDEYRKARRDVTIGVAVAGGLSPLTGATPALLAAAGIGARSVASLAWSWLGSRREKDSLQAVINCFMATHEQD